MKTIKNSRKFSTEEVKRVAKLANLPITQDEVNKFAPQLTNILSFVSRLQEIDTKNVTPTSQVNGLTNVFREDVIDVSRTLTQEQALSNARKKHNGFFVVPSIFE